MYNPTKKADFEKAYDAIDWAEYYKTMGIGDFEQIIVTTPSALANANELMKTDPRWRTSATTSPHSTSAQPPAT